MMCGLRRRTQGRLAIAALAVAALAMFQPGACGAGEKKAPLPIIPGAHGFGMETPAGSGRNLNPPRTTVYKVTNLNDSGPGSFRAAYTAKGPRVVVFEVSGYITLKSTLGTRNPYLTVAGQTAPWPGIVIRGGYTTGVPQHALIQHLGFRSGDKMAGRYLPTRNALTLGDNAVIDHCSFGWGTQVAVHFMGGHNMATGSNSTMRLSIVSEPLYHAGHNEGNHSRAILTYGTNISEIGNLIAHSDDRNPQVGRHTTAAILNNVMYNCAAEGVKMMEDNYPAISIQGNVFIPGVDTLHVPRRPWRGKFAWIYVSDKSRVFLSPDNLIAGKLYKNPWEHINARGAHCRGKPSPLAMVSKPPVVVPGYQVKPARATEKWVLANVGPFPAHRNPIDARVVYEVRHRIGRGRDDMDDISGWPKLEENHRKLTLPKNPNGDDDGDGYTNLEEWLHGFADLVEGRKGPVPGADPDLGKREAERCNLSQEEKLKEAKALYEKVKKQPKADWTFDAAEAKRRQKEAAKKAGLPVERKIDLGGGVALELMLIPPGEFEMGSKYPPKVIKWLRGPAQSPRGQSGAGVGAIPVYRREHPRQRIRISSPFYIAKYELTRDVYGKVTGNKMPGGPRLPAMLRNAFGHRKGKPWMTDRPGGVGYFILVLNEKVGKKAGLIFRLPREAEWEYACRAGTDTPFCFGETISAKQANYDARFPWDGKHDYPAPALHEKGGFRTNLIKVGRFAPNPWGLYDTVGNATELVAERYGPYPTFKQKVVDVSTWSAAQRDRKRIWTGEIRTVRGGSWKRPPADARSAYGVYLAGYDFKERAGVRLVADPAAPNWKDIPEDVKWCTR